MPKGTHLPRAATLLPFTILSSTDSLNFFSLNIIWLCKTLLKISVDCRGRWGPQRRQDSDCILAYQKFFSPSLGLHSLGAGSWRTGGAWEVGNRDGGMLGPPARSAGRQRSEFISTCTETAVLSPFHAGQGSQRTVGTLSFLCSPDTSYITGENVVVDGFSLRL